MQLQVGDALSLELWEMFFGARALTGKFCTGGGALISPYRHIYRQESGVHCSHLYVAFGT